MFVSSSPHVLCRADFHRHWYAALAQLDPDRQRIVAQLGPIDWLAWRLLDMLETHHDQPADELKPVIRRLLLEQDFVDENGDSVIDAREHEHLDVKVDLLVRVLEALRQEARARGHWSDAPVTPQMCG